jgi:hypothetical protein
MTGIQVDLILRAIQPEPDGPLCFAAVEVINEEEAYFLRHGYCVLSFTGDVLGTCTWSACSLGVRSF